MIACIAKDLCNINPAVNFCYCPKCDCEMTKSSVSSYWQDIREQAREEEDQTRYENRNSYYDGYAELLQEAQRKGDTRRVFLNINDTSLNPF